MSRVLMLCVATAMTLGSCRSLATAPATRANPAENPVGRPIVQKKLVLVSAEHPQSLGMTLGFFASDSYGGWKVRVYYDYGRKGEYLGYTNLVKEDDFSITGIPENASRGVATFTAVSNNHVTLHIPEELIATPRTAWKVEIIRSGAVTETYEGVAGSRAVGGARRVS